MLALAVACQHLEVSPKAAELEQTVEVRAVDANRRPLPDLAVSVELPDGSQSPLGSTNAAGVLPYRVHQVGLHVFEAAMPNGTRLLAPYQVRDRRSRWPYALVCIPLGLVLGYVNMRRLRRQPRDPPSDGAGARRPSPPVP